jgi:hypothetical protein
MLSLYEINKIFEFWDPETKKTDISGKTIK